MQATEVFGVQGKQKRVLTFGEPLVVCSHESLERLSLDRRFLLDLAGAELNTAIALGRMGVPVTFAGAVGDDLFGEFILRELRAEMVEVKLVDVVPTRLTGVLFKKRNPLQKDPVVLSYRTLSPMAVGDWRADACVNDLLTDCYQWVHTTGILRMVSAKARQETDRILGIAHENGIPISFDINVRRKMGDHEAWLQNLREVIGYIDWLFLGDEEADFLFQMVNPQKLELLLRELGFQGYGIVVKKGARGSTACLQGEEIDCPIVPVDQVVDTVGAGDGFNAGFIAGLLRGDSVDAALKRGSILGAYAVTSLGDAGGYPDAATVDRYLAGESEVTR